MESRQLFCMGLGVFEDRDVALGDGSKVGEQQVHAAYPSVYLSRGDFFVM